MRKPYERLPKMQLGSAFPTDESGLSENDIRPEPISPIPEFEIPQVDPTLVGSTTDTPEVDNALQSINYEQTRRLDMEQTDPIDYYSKYGAHQIADLERAGVYSPELSADLSPDGAAVPMEKYDGVNAEGPNIYRDNMSACQMNGIPIEQCSAGMQLAMDFDKDFDVRQRKDLGIVGDSWTMRKNILNRGGESVYNLYDGEKPMRRNSRGVYNMLRESYNDKGVDPNQVDSDAVVGDVVEMYYRGSSFQEDAINDGQGAVTTHIGVVSTHGGEKYVTHNIHGTWHSDLLKDLVRGKGKILVAGMVRPDYGGMMGDQNVRVSENPRMVFAGSGKREAVEVTDPGSVDSWKSGFATKRASKKFAGGMNYYAPYVQKDYGLDRRELETVMRASFGIFAQESNFGESDAYKKKAERRNIYRAYKQNVNFEEGSTMEWLTDSDALSEGPSQMKLDLNYSSQESQALLERYGVNYETIYDPRVASAATLLNTARNYKLLQRALGPQLKEVDDITLRNILALSHNKGVETLLKNDFSSNGEFNEETIAAGLKNYHDLHIRKIKGADEGVSYSNKIADYGSSIDINYEKMLEEHEKEERVSYEAEHYQTSPEKLEESVKNTYNDAVNFPRDVAGQAKSDLLDFRDQARDERAKAESLLEQMRAKYSKIKAPGNDLANKLLATSFINGKIGMPALDKVGNVAELGMEMAKDSVADVSPDVLNEQIGKMVSQVDTSSLPAPSELIPDIGDIALDNGIILSLAERRTILTDSRWAAQSMEPEEFLSELLAQRAGAGNAVESVTNDLVQMADDYGLSQEEMNELVNDEEYSSGAITKEEAIQKIIQRRRIAEGY